MKKLTSIFLAMVMMFALAIPALAQQNNDTGSTELEHEYEYTGEQETMTIDLKLPGATNIVLNPYKMQHSDTASFYVDKLADQVFSIPSTVRSKSNVALKVGMKITGAPEGVTFVANDQAATLSANDAKNVYVAMQYGLTDADGAPPTPATKMNDIVISSTAKDLTDAEMVTMPIGNTTPQYLSIVFTGAANDKPSEAYTPDDKIGVTIAYTFIPVMSEDIQLKYDGVFDQSNNVTVVIPTANWFYTSDNTHNTVTITSPASIVHHDAVAAQGTEGQEGYVPAVAEFDEISLAADTKTLTITKEYITQHMTAYTTANAAAAPTNNTAAKKFVIVVPIELEGDVKTSDGDATANPVVPPTYDEDVRYTYNVRIVCLGVAAQNNNGGS